ncbi:armadillo repeat-containing protein 7 [Lasius niger]|uniref:Armadillo repeat-containing protein 7 n=1 Tax=Lasius niger TaxID=67767 RepID=A0A0J7KTJ2_LASNI|nr:armadillo repeat-containing protein 7 [Lasius niger]
MFSTKARLIKRTGKNSVGRYDFLKLLAIEYKTTKSRDAKEQVLANLANFAYDPINYGYIRQLQIIDIFLETLSENNPKLIRFAIGGICNLCLGDYNPIHTESARNIAHGALLNGLVSGLIGTKLPGAGTIVIKQNLTFPNPCYAGDSVEKEKQKL